jgi:hypothetical protein
VSGTQALSDAELREVATTLLANERHAWTWPVRNVELERA